MNETEKLRAELSRRGVGYETHDMDFRNGNRFLETAWEIDNGMHATFQQFSDEDDMTALTVMWHLTAEQDIEATLGRGTCEYVWSLADNGWADYTCSNCGHVENMDINNYPGFDYCPKCGAKVVNR